MTQRQSQRQNEGPEALKLQSGDFPLLTPFRKMCASSLLDRNPVWRSCKVFMGTPRHRTASFLIVPLIVLSASQSRSLKAQESAPPLQTAAADPSSLSASQQTTEILRMLSEMHQELKDSRQEVEDLKKEVNELREELAASTQSSSGAEALKSAVDELHDDQQVVQSEVKTLEQTKVGTESRFPVRLNGMILFNSFVVDGAVDNPILPLIALPRTTQWAHHSMGASVEQTQLGLSASGPKLWDARTSADLAVDFFGPTNYATIPPPTAMNLRLRTLDANLDWKNTQVSVGLQTPLITPLSPTSFATVGEPALAWAGNLWTWLPQATVTRRANFTDSSRGVFEFGLLDPQSGYVTGEQAYGIVRRGLQPGYEGRVAYEWGDAERPYQIAANGYYTRQLYYYSSATNQQQPLDFWAATADWRVPMTGRADLSGEFYRGRGLGDLGGGAFKNVIKEYGAEYPSGLNATGGWTQLKFHITPTFETNAYFGEDSARASEVRDQAPVVNPSPYLYLVRNQSVAMNLIYRPKTYLVFSGEYRYLKSWYTYGSPNEAQTLDLTMGYLF
jgi:hypothetical protein